MDDVIYFVSFAHVKNEYGVYEDTETLSDPIYCKVESVTRQEFYQAGQNNFKPSYKITTFHGNYSGESLIEYEGERLSIYRTYRIPNSDYIELYVERKTGRE